MVLTFTISKCQNHEADCAKFFGLLRRPELFEKQVYDFLQFSFMQINTNAKNALLYKQV